MISKPEFLKEWRQEHAHIELIPLEVALSFDMTRTEAKAFLESLVKSGDCTSYKTKLSTVYKLA